MLLSVYFFDFHLTCAASATRKSRYLVAMRVKCRLQSITNLRKVLAGTDVRVRKRRRAMLRVHNISFTPCSRPERALATKKPFYDGCLVKGNSEQLLRVKRVDLERTALLSASRAMQPR